MAGMKLNATEMKMALGIGVIASLGLIYLFFNGDYGTSPNAQYLKYAYGIGGVAMLGFCAWKFSTLPKAGASDESTGEQAWVRRRRQMMRRRRKRRMACAV